MPIVWVALAPPACCQAPAATTVLAQARTSQANGDFRRAVELAKQAQLLVASQRLPDQLAQLECLDLLADVYQQSGRLIEAEQAATEHLRLVQQPDVAAALAQREQMQRSLVRLGEIEAALDRPAAARGHFQQALNAPGGLRDSDPLWEPDLLWRISNLLSSTDRKDAVVYLQRGATLVEGVLKHYERQLPTSQELEAAIELQKQLALARGKPEQAIEQLASWPKRVRKSPSLCASILIQLAACQQAAGQAQAANISCREAAELLKTLPDKPEDRIEFGRLLVRLAEQCASDVDLVSDIRRRAVAVLESVVATPGAAGEKSAAIEPASRLLRAQCCDLLHVLYQQTLQWSKAINALNKLEELEAPNLLADDPRTYRLRSLLGACYLQEENCKAARPWLEDSERFFDGYCHSWPAASSVSGPPAQLELELAATRVNLSYVYEAGQFQQSLDLLTRAEASYRRLAPDDVRRAECLVNLAGKTAAIGHFDTAEQQYDEAIQILRRTKAPSAQLDDILSAAELNLAMLYKSQNQLSRALRLCESALSRRKQTSPSAKALIPCYAACAALRVAIFQQNQGESNSNGDLLHSAVADARSAEELLRRHDMLQTTDAAEVYYTLAAALQSLRQQSASPSQSSEAESLWIQALALAQQTNRPVLQIRCLNRLVEIEAKRNLDKAEKLSRQALEIQERLAAYPAIRFNALFNAAQIAHSRGRTEEAIRLLERAIQIVETPRAFTTGAQRDRAIYLAQFQRAFDLLFTWQAAAGDYDQALVTHELRHNRTFLDEVLAAKIDVGDGVEPKLLREAEKISADYYLKASQLRLAESNVRGAEQHILYSAADWKRELDELAEKHRQKLTDLRRASRFYQDVRTEPTSNEAKASVSRAIQELLADRGAALIYYVGQTRSHLLLAWESPEPRFEHYRLQISTEQAAQLGLAATSPLELGEGTLLNLVNSAVAALSQSPGDATPPLSREQLSILSEVLVPLAARQKIAELQPRSIAVIPDGAIEKLPLEALPHENGYLLEVLPPLHYLPSARIAVALSQPLPAVTAAKFLTVAPEYQPGGKFPPLRGNKAESGAVAAALEKAGLSGTRLIGMEATENRVAESLRGKRFIHLAAHAEVSDQDVEQDNLLGFIALTQPSSATAVDGRLTLAEIRGLDLRGCELIALSACHTNCGPNHPLEAGSTLARACFAAGARCVVASQWTTDDAASELLMTRFFESVGASLAAGQPPDYARCLHDAKRAVRNSDDWKLPKYWAPLVLIGPARGATVGQASSPRGNASRLMGQASSRPDESKLPETSRER